MGKRALVAAVALFAAHASAIAQTAVRATDVVNVRSGPGTGYGILGQVPAGHTYVAPSKSGDWWKIWYDGGMGYIHSAYTTTVSGTTGVKVTTDALNVRNGPGTGYAILGQIYLGQIYFWTQHEGLNGWYKIHFDGGIGYCHGGYVTRVALSGSAPPTGTTSNLPMAWAKQETNYWCGPATAHMTIRYVSGNWVAQSTLAWWMGTTPSLGTGAYVLCDGINHYSGAGYWVAYGFSRDKAVANIQKNKPVPINFNTGYVAYWNYYVAYHHSPIKGYTSGGFYVHDSWMGPDKWVSSTEAWNAVNYHYGLYLVRH
jgi:uncharacterized protein YraI